MKLTLKEKIRLARKRSGLTQKEFYKGICDRQCGSYFETNNKNINSTYESMADEVSKKIHERYNLEQMDVTVGEFAKILRQRAGDSIVEAANKVNRSRVWVISAEKGDFFAGKLFKLYKKDN